jgi:hypothetical protein
MVSPHLLESTQLYAESIDSIRLGPEDADSSARGKARPNRRAYHQIRYTLELLLVVLLVVMTTCPRRIRGNNRPGKQRQSNDSQHVIPELLHRYSPSPFPFGSRVRSPTGLLSAIILPASLKNLHMNLYWYILTALSPPRPCRLE